ncbi:MAG: hypothetical protein Salg2KO_16190 [Salibacteraceae bacterium]
MTSCSTNPSKAETEAEREAALQAQEDSLLSVFMEEISAIDSKLKEVNTSNGIFEESKEGGKVLSKESVLARVESLNNLLEKNQSELDRLMSSMKKNEIKNKELENMMKGMRQRIAQKEEQIDDLMGMLTDKDMKIDEILLRMDSMRIDNIELSEEVIKMDEELHIVHYIVGEKAELIEKEIITKEGGLLGIGATKKLDASNLDQSLFTQVDERELLSVPIYSKKATIITNHPEAAYDLVMDSDGNVETLEIKDRNAFWSASEYLVVEVKN